MPLLSKIDEQILVTANRYSIDAAGNLQAEDRSIIENRHLGWLCVTNRQGHILYSTPRAAASTTFFRSSAKPFQAFPLVENGYYHDLSTQELAITCASHTGSAEHIVVSQALLTKAGLTEASLQCGPHAPSDPEMSKQLRQSGEAPRRFMNNCSGKHAGMLYYCHRAGLDPATYLHPHHPLQQQILKTIQHWSGIQDIPLAIDGCGAPIFYLPLTSMAQLYAHLGTSPEFTPLQQAMTAHPELIGGTGRVDTTIMQVSQGKLLAKVGADGVFCVSRVDEDQGLALKLSDGSAEVRDLTLIQILIHLNWLDAEALADSRIKPFLEKRIRKNTQDLAVGEYKINLH